MSSITQSIPISKSPDRIQGWLLISAGVFLALYAIALTIAPAARARAWGVGLRWDHWIGYLVWLSLIVLAHHQTKRHLPNRDPYLLPVAVLLSGWGLMTIWRLFPDFGIRQTIWLAVAVGVFTLGLRLPSSLDFLRRYKYVWLVSGLVLTGLTLILGTNPSSISGPRLWLGCCGVYFQPSEPLKLLLIIFLSAYLADKQPWVRISTPIHLEGENEAQAKSGKYRPARNSSLPLLAPILFMTGLTLLLLLVQRDLGTATIFVFLFTIIVYLATERKLILFLSALLLFGSAVSGYYLFDVVRLRIDAWLNPWVDPSGRSYQIVQSILAMANGGVSGRGPGMGSPSLVPISHSDFIFSAILEESGLVGGIALIALLMLLTASGLRLSLRAPDNFRRYLAAGLTAYLVGQSLLIIGGNIRLLPLTGVTLPFVSYGGSSLVTAYISLLILALISQSANTNPVSAPNPSLYTNLGIFLLSSLVVAAIVVGWWTYFRGPTLLDRTDNVRRAIADRYVRRGEILDRHDIPLATTNGSPGDYSRSYEFPELGSLIGYSHPVYGQSGLEANLDPYLRGLLGNPDFELWWNRLLYGQPPPGLDVRLSLDMDLQEKADELLADHSGALVLLNADNGEILSIASHPTFDPNTLDETWSDLINDADTPLLNRVTQGQYQPGTSLGPFLLAAQSAFPPLPRDLSVQIDGQTLDCSFPTAGNGWAEVIANGCPQPQIVLGEELGIDNVMDLMDNLGMFSIPNINPNNEEVSIQAESLSLEEIMVGQSELLISPLQMVRAAATLSAGGVRPKPLLVSAINLPETGWTGFPPAEESHQVFSIGSAENVVESLANKDLPIWQSVAMTPNGPDEEITWYLAGTLPSWNGAPLALVILLEGDDPEKVLEIGELMMEAVLGMD
jgi:cell division protein FtsW (lipid II flippase)